MVISISSHGLISIAFVYCGENWWSILLSLYPLTPTSVLVSSSELPEDSSVETWSFIFFREKQIASNCSCEGPGFDWSITILSLLPLLLPTISLVYAIQKIHYLLFSFYKGFTLFVPVILDKRNTVFNVFDDLVYLSSLLVTQMYPIIESFVYDIM